MSSSFGYSLKCCVSGTLKTGSWVGEWKAESRVHKKKFCLLRYFCSTPMVCPKAQHRVLQRLLLLVQGPVCLFCPKFWITPQVGRLCAELRVAVLLCAAGVPAHPWEQSVIHPQQPDRLVATTASRSMGSPGCRGGCRPALHMAAHPREQGQACPYPRSDLFGARINVMAPLLIILLLSQHPSSCNDGAVEPFLPHPSLPHLKSALCLYHRCLICFLSRFMG